MDRSIPSAPADNRPDGRGLLPAALLTAFVMLAVLVVEVSPAAAGGVVSKGLVDPPAWSATEPVQFVPAPPARAGKVAARHAFIQGTSEVSGEELEYHKEAEGKGVEHTPKVYVIFWGSNFTNLTSGKETQAKLETLFKGLETKGTENSSYQGILTQYFDTHSHVSPKVTVTFISDTSVAAPTGVGTRAVRTEAEKYRAKNESTENLENAQFMVVAAPGSTYEAGFEPAGEGFCAYHNLDNVGYAFTFVPYEGDKPFTEKGCLESDGSENAVHETSRFASAVYADAVTDPHMNAWKTKAGHEIDYGSIAKPCAKELDLELPTGAWAQNLYDDHLLGCKHTDLSPPSVYVVSQPATAVNPTEGTLTAVVNPESLTTKYYFEWGLTNSYGNRTPVETLNPSLENSAVTATIAKLGTETTYHYRIAAENSTGITYGYDGTFTTLKAEPPYALTEPASNVEETTATLNGTINPKQLPTKFFFEWGETENYSSKTTENIGTGSSNIPLHETLPTPSLHPLHEYHYRIRAESAGGLEFGLDKAFTTPGWVAGPGFYGGSLSCPAASPRTCMMAGGSSEGETYFWNGASWHSETVAVPPGFAASWMHHVSCWAANGCIGYGREMELVLVREKTYEQVEYPATWLWNGTQWSFQSQLSRTPLIDGAFSLGPISCTSASFCQAIFNPFPGRAQEAYVWNGGQWSPVSVPVPPGGSGSEVSALSCGSATLCEGVGWTNPEAGALRFIDTWNGQSWSVSETVEAKVQNWLGISCLPAECLIVGTRSTSWLLGHESGGIVMRSAGGVFTEKELPLPAGANEFSVQPTAISCVARETCVLAGDYVKTSTGLEEVLVDQQSPQHAGGAWYPAHLPAFQTGNKGTRENQVSCWSALGCMVQDGAGGPSHEVFGPELRLEDSPLPANTKLPAMTPSAPEQGTAESVSAGSWAHEPTSYSYQWELCNASGGECASISGATSTSYTPSEANLGHTLRVKVSATNSIGSESVYTTISPAITPPPAPVNTTLPAVSPSSPEVGVTESSTTGTWTREITGYSYQWELCNLSGGECASISGATSSTYLPTEANAGHALRITVTAKNSGGSTPASSAATSPVVARGHFTQTIDSPNSIRAISCIASTTDCVVTDSTGKALYATNVSATGESTWKAWTGPSGASPSQAIVCPSTGLCLIADGKETAGGKLYSATSLGGSFTEDYNPVYGVDAISCVSASLCVTGQDGEGYYRFATSPASTSWTLEQQGTAAMKAVGCLSTGICAIVDSQGKAHIATTISQIESSTWKETNVDGTTALTGVACTSTTSCVAVDGAGYVLNLNVESSGAAKVTKNHLDGTNALTAVTCSSASCVAVDNVGNLFESANSGTSWSKAYALSDSLTSVSCASTNLCVTADTTGHVTAFRPE